MSAPLICPACTAEVHRDCFGPDCACCGDESEPEPTILVIWNDETQGDFAAACAAWDAEHADDIPFPPPTTTDQQ